MYLLPSSRSGVANGSRKRGPKLIAVGIAFIAILSTLTIITAQPASAASANCPAHRLCVYTDKNWGGNYDYWQYKSGCVNLTNTGFNNNITGVYSNGVKAIFWTLSGCKGAPWVVHADTHVSKINALYNDTFSSVKYY